MKTKKAMKKITHIGMAALVAMGMLGTSCNKVESQEMETPKDNIVTLTTTVGFADDTKALAIDYTAKTLTKTFAVGEQVVLTYEDQDGNNPNTVSQALTPEDISADGKSAKLTFTLTNPKANGSITYRYPASMLKDNGHVKTSYFYAQNGTLTDVATRDYAEYDGFFAGTNLPASATLDNEFAVVAFTLYKSDGTTDITNTISGMTIEVSGVTYTITPSGLDKIYVAMWPEGGSEITITATDGSKNYTKTLTGKTYKAGEFYQQGLKMAEVKPDLLSGVFSVSDSKKVSFSKGNLQATYDGSNWTWAFAANQWDYIGNAAGNTKVTASSPYISEKATVDLFGWVGASSTWTGVNKYGITSSSATNNTNGYGNVASESLKSDWGALIGLGWRTLSMAEWTYLLTTRTVNGGTGENKSYTLNQSVNGKKGMVIYPDNYTGAVYSGSNWASFEAAGCVFLPAAGWREGTTIQNINDRGFYWSSTPANTTDAKSMFFAGGLDLSGTYWRNFGFSVRLVREVE